MPGLGWRVYASRSTAAVLGPTRVLLARETGLTAAALLVLGAMLVVVNRRIARPLAALTRAVGLAGGQDAPAPLPASGPSEVRRLAAAFNQAISARARSEQQLRDDREQLRLWARQLPAVLWSTDRELRLQQVAGSAVANLTRPVAELTGRVVAESLAATAPDRARSTVLAAHQRALAGEAAAFELELAGRTYQAHVEPFRDDAGQVTGTVGLALDLHDRWRAEAEVRRLNAELERRVLERTAALAAANAELDAFSYSVSHDLRAPLHTVSGFAQALLEDAGDQLDATAQEHLGRIQAASAHMGQLIDGLLRLSRAARSPLRRARVDLSALVAATADDLRRRDPGRAVEVHVPAGIVARGDAQLLAVVVENLLGNAWKFTGKHPTAKIQFGADDGKGEPAFFVRDDGAGFDPAYADKLFGAFQRLHAANQFDGSGIGLATVQRIVARHGGRVWAEGLPEQGATFWFTLGPADTDEERPS